MLKVCLPVFHLAYCSWLKKIFNLFRFASFFRSQFLNLSGGRVSNTWAIYLLQGDNTGKLVLIPHNTALWHHRVVKGAIRSKMGSRLIS